VTTLVKVVAPQSSALRRFARVAPLWIACLWLFRSTFYRFAKAFLGLLWIARL